MSSCQVLAHPRLHLTQGTLTPGEERKKMEGVL